MQVDTTSVGLHFRGADAKRIVNELEVGQIVHLQRDPGNQYSPNDTAVMVLAIDPTTGLQVHIGFIPETDNGPIAAALDEGVDVEVEVNAYGGPGKPGLTVTWDDGEFDRTGLGDEDDSTESDD